ncbi:MAG: glycoside hydrolase family 25 protein [Devosia sp.]|jgi:lysozyme|nr:GH25 family lysozyme [Devosiaceae bacterium]
MISASPGWRHFLPVRMLLLVLLTLALASCARQPGYRPIEGDNRPHPGVDRARSMPIQGVDISRYQGQVDFDRLRAWGAHFVFIKATEGADYVDPNFSQNWARARAAGLPRAAYHFMYWCSYASEQAKWFRKNVPNDPDALPPVLDVEWNNQSACGKRLDRDAAFAKVKYMLDEMERYTGKLPIIYTDMNFHREVLAGRNLPNTFWLRSVAAEPDARYDGDSFTFWQWTTTGTVPGIRGEVDRDVFYGTPDEWTVFLLTGCDPRALATLGPTGRCYSQK